MGQFDASLESGHTTASVALKRLAGCAAKNRFYRANRDLGRSIRPKWGMHFIQVHPMGCGLAAPEQECEIARIVRVAAKPTHTRIHCGGSLRAATPRIGRATQPHAAPEQ